MPEDQQLAAQQNIVGMEQTIVDFRRKKFSQPDGEIYLKLSNHCTAPILAAAPAVACVPPGIVVN